MTAKCLQDSRCERKKHVNLLQTGMNKVRGHNHSNNIYIYIFGGLYNSHNRYWVPDVQLGQRFLQILLLDLYF